MAVFALKKQMVSDLKVQVLKNYNFGSVNPENGGFGSAKLIWETDKVNRRLEGVVGALKDMSG